MGGALHKACAFTVVAILPVCYILYPTLVPMSLCWTFFLLREIPVNTTDLLSPLQSLPHVAFPSLLSSRRTL